MGDFQVHCSHSEAREQRYPSFDTATPDSDLYGSKIIQADLGERSFLDSGISGSIGMVATVLAILQARHSCVTWRTTERRLET